MGSHPYHTYAHSGTGRSVRGVDSDSDNLPNTHETQDREPCTLERSGGTTNPAYVEVIWQERLPPAGNESPANLKPVLLLAHLDELRPCNDLREELIKVAIHAVR